MGEKYACAGMLYLLYSKNVDMRYALVLVLLAVFHLCFAFDPERITVIITLLHNRRLNSWRLSISLNLVL